MTKDDFKRFGVAWTKAQKAYGKEVEGDVLAMLFRVLEPYALADVEGALLAHMRDPDGGQYAPKPADVVRRLGGRDDAKAAVAWSDFRAATRSGDMPADPTLCRVIERMGGLDRLGDMTSRDLDFAEKQFKALWLAHDDPTRLGIGGEQRLGIANGAGAVAASLAKHLVRSA